MTRLPSSLQPAWPLVKRLHRLASLLTGLVVRRTSRLQGPRALPRRATTSSVDTAALEPDAVTIHRVDSGEDIRREPAQGTPAGHWVFEKARTFDVPARLSLEIERGVVVGDYGANVTPGGTLDYETSDYFGISSWREHPIYLRRSLPPVEHVDGTLVSLATRGGSINYYHFLLDVLPRFGVFEETMPGHRADALYVPAAAKWQRDLLELAGLGDHHVVETRKHRAVSADRLVVPCLPNPKEVAPRATIEWLRSRLPAGDIEGLPKRIYVTRGSARNSRRMVHEEAFMPLLEQRGFVRIEPGGMSVRDQIDQYAAAEVIVAPHGAALTNLVFARPGVRVLEMFPASYVNACFWAITDSIPDARYTYLIGGDVSEHGPGSPMNRIQADIDLSPEAVIAAVDELLAV
jgi:capsular polysaccharide biosynthesis protein